MSLITLEADDVVAVVDTLGGRVSQLTVRGHDLLVPFSGRWTLAGCYPMVPWAGRMREGRFRFGGHDREVPVPKPPHAMHGVATDVEWDVVGDGRFRVDLGNGWPLGGFAEVSYELSDTSLSCRVSVTAGDQPMPAVVGFHPCFVRELGGHPDHLDFGPGFMWERGDDYLPTGRRLEPPPPGPWDDCFGGVERPPRLSWGDVISVELRSPTTTWVAFNQLDVAICVEPQTDTPDAFNMSGGRRLAAGESLDLPLDLVWSTPPSSAGQ